MTVPDTEKNSYGPQKISLSIMVLVAMTCLIVLVLISRYNFLLFHVLAELFSIMVAWSVFILVWNTKDFSDNDALIFLGTAYFFVGFIDLFHTISYKGMGIFSASWGANLPTQLWIAARYMESISLVIFPLVLGKRLKPQSIFLGYVLVTILIFVSIFFWKIFPICYQNDVGLTVFKKGSEYVICLILIGALALLVHRRSILDTLVFRLTAASIAMTILAELVFTFYVGVYDFSNLIGHYFKIVSFFLIYLALVRSGITRPLALLFRDLSQKEKELRKVNTQLKAFLENSPALLSIYDSNGIYRNVSRSTADLLGRSLEEIPGMSFDDFFEPDHASEFRKRALTLAATNAPLSVNDIVPSATGRQRVLRSMIFPMFESDHEEQLFGAVSIDISELKQAEESLRRSQQILDLINRIKSIFLTVADNAVFEEVLQVILEALESPHGIFFCVDEHEGRLIPAMIMNIRDQCPLAEKEALFKAEHLDRTIWGQSINQKKGIKVNLPFSVPSGHVPVIRAMATPLVHMDKIIGILVVGNKTSDYTDQDLDLLTEISNHIAPVLDAEMQKKRQQADRKRAEQALRVSETRFREFFDQNSNYCYMVSPEGAIIDINPAALEALGYQEKEELIGKSIIKTVYHESSRNKAKRLFSQWKRAGEIKQEEITIVTKTGEKRTVLLNASRVKDEHGKTLHSISVQTDITQRKKAEESLKESEEKYRTTFENIPDMITINRIEDGRFSYVNDSFCTFNGYSREEVIGRTPMDLNLHEFPEDQEKMLMLFEKNGQLLDYEIRFRKKDGTIFDSLLSARPITTQNNDLLVTLVRDITEQKKLEKEKATLQSQLHQAQKMEAIGTLAGGIAHDFNNLLQAISGYSQLILFDKSEDDPEFSNIMAILNAGQRAADLVRQLLLFSRKAETERRPVDLNHEIEQAKNILERTLPKMVDIVVHLGSRLWTVMADPVQMEQILLNLGTNASDAMPDGGQLVIETENIILNEGYARNHLEVQPGKFVVMNVSDNGQGIEPETMDHIFEPFFTTKELGLGTGLGLASLYGIVKRHGGHVTCYSEVGQGTTFRIYLPALDDEDANLINESESAPLQGGHETILLVDDEEFIRDFASQILTKFGYAVLTTSSGEKAIEIYTNKTKAIDLIIMDLGMPGMGGHRCLQELMRLDPEVKVLIASGYALNQQVKKTLDEGAVGYIPKPYQLTDLLKKVRSAL